VSGYAGANLPVLPAWGSANRNNAFGTLTKLGLEAVYPQNERPLSATKQAPVAADVPETWSDETAIGADRLTIDPATIRAG